MRLEGSSPWKRAFASGSRAVLAAVGIGLAVAHGGAPFASGATPTLRYVAVGDSLTQAGATAPGGWVIQYASAVDSDLHTTTAIINLGSSGATSAQILDSVRHDSLVRAAIAGADLVTYQAGINDFFFMRGPYIDGTCGGADGEDCLRSMVANFKSNWDLLVNEIQSLAPSATKRTMNLYYSVTAYDQTLGYFPVLDSYLGQMNAHILSNPGATADVHLAYNGPTGADDPYAKGYVLPDAVHPTELGHDVIADAVRSLGYFGLDADADYVADATDNCLNIANPSQANRNAEIIPLPKPKPPFDDLTNVIGDNVGDACETDIDHDGIPNEIEIMLGTSPFIADTDGDRTNDGTEIACGSNPLNVLSNLTGTASDNDSLPDTCEVTYGTNPNTIKQRLQNELDRHADAGAAIQQRRHRSRMGRPRYEWRREDQFDGYALRGAALRLLRGGLTASVEPPGPGGLYFAVTGI